MNLKARRYVEEQKQQAQKKLVERVALLKTRGMESKEIAQNTTVRKLKADVRKAGFRLRSIAAAEDLKTRRLQQKQEKAAAESPAKKDKTDKSVKKEKKIIEKAPA